MWVLTFETKNTLAIHNCAIDEAESHLCLVVNSMDMSIIFYGHSNFYTQNGLAYSFTGEYFSLNNKSVTLENPPPRPTLQQLQED